MSFLFFRNTHTGPNYDQYRKDLPLGKAENAAEGAAQGLFLLHFLDHQEGLSFDQLVAEVREYENQFPESGPMGIEDILADLQDSLKVGVIRVEEQKPQASSRVSA